jgi:hypothetical protein
MRNLLWSLLLAAATTAQVAPASLTTVEGNAASLWPFDRGIGRYQQIHRHVPGPVTITGIAFRRNATTAPTPTPRWWSEFTVRMGPGDFERARPVFATNELQPATTVVLRRRHVLPDWSIPSTTTPRPFDFVIPFDVPYVHDGLQPLLWEIEVFDESNLGTLGAVDGFTDPVFTLSHGVSAGAGCGFSLSGQIAALSDNRYQLWLGEWPYVGVNPRLYVFGFTDPNLVHPELCTALRVDPVAVRFEGPGAAFVHDVPYDPAFAGVVVRAQFLTPNGPRLSLSNARVLTFPPMPSFGDRDVVSVHATAAGTPTVERGTGVVVNFL